MQVRRSLFVACLVTLGLGVACSEAADPPGGTPAGDDDDDGPSSSGSPSSSGGPSRDGGSSSSSGGSSSSSGTVDGSSRPVECKLLVPDGFANGPGLTPRQYGAQPTFRTTVVTPDGDEARQDLLALRIDAATGLGVHPLAGPAGEDNCYENSAQCMYLHEDVSSGSSNRFFAAVRGQIRIDAQITADQSAGVIEYVELREAAIQSRNVPFPAATLVPGGACLWIENATFDTRRPGGCDPRKADACGAGEACIRENAAGTDGTCRTSTGSGTNGAACVVDTLGGSSCNVEHMCSEDAPGSRKCRRLCDLFSAGNVCPTNTICGPFGYCEPPKSTAVDETSSIGEPCPTSRFFCGADGARGVCFNATDDQVPPRPLPEGPLCHALEYARSACGTDDIGYLPFEGYEDRSLGTCVPRQ